MTGHAVMPAKPKKPKLERVKIRTDLLERLRLIMVVRNETAEQTIVRSGFLEWLLPRASGEVPQSWVSGHGEGEAVAAGKAVADAFRRLKRRFGVRSTDAFETCRKFCEFVYREHADCVQFRSGWPDSPPAPVAAEG